MCNDLSEELSLCCINSYQISIMGNNRADENEYLKRRENQSHPHIKLPTITGTNFEEFDLAFTDAVRIQNDLIGIPLDYLLITR